MNFIPCGSMHRNYNFKEQMQNCENAFFPHFNSPFPSPQVTQDFSSPLYATKQNPTPPKQICFTMNLETFSSTKTLAFASRNLFVMYLNKTFAFFIQLSQTSSSIWTAKTHPLIYWDNKTPLIKLNITQENK